MLVCGTREVDESNVHFAHSYTHSREVKGNSMRTPIRWQWNIQFWMRVCVKENVCTEEYHSSITVGVYPRLSCNVLVYSVVSETLYLCCMFVRHSRILHYVCSLDRQLGTHTMKKMHLVMFLRWTIVRLWHFLQDGSHVLNKSVFVGVYEWKERL